MFGAMDELTARERFNYYFPNRKHVFILAAHIGLDRKVWQADINTAHHGGMDGIIVIRDYNTEAVNEDVLQAYDWAREHYPLWWIGVNLLGYRPHEAVLKVRTGTSGLWFDDSYIHERNPLSPNYLENVKMKSDILHIPEVPLIMPSVAMKGCRPDENIAVVGKMAEPHSDVIVTSGYRTGEASAVAKLRTLRTAVDIPIGIASGIDADNVRPFVELGVEMFIVNTSLNTDGMLDPAKVRSLRALIPQ